MNEKQAVPVRKPDPKQPGQPRNQFLSSMQNPLEYIQRRIAELRAEGRLSLSKMLEEEMQATINRALFKYATQIGGGRLTIKI